MLLKESLQKSRMVVQGGEQLNGVRIQFSEDAKLMYVSCGTHVKVFSHSSKEVVHVFRHHSYRVTSVLINPANKMQVYTASQDGQLALWDTTDGALLKVIDFSVPIYKVVIRPKLRDPSVFFLIQKKGDHKLSVVGMPSSVLTERQPTVAPSDQILAAKKSLKLWKSNRDLIFNFDGTHLIADSGKVLFVHDLEAERTYSYTCENIIQCVAAHPTKNCVATGSETGKIYLWFNYAHKDTDVVKTTLHWHAHAVADLCFTTDGTYLLSGGEEGVLVLWQLDTNKKQFRPRLGSPITRLACCPGDKFFTVGLESNVIHVVSGLDTGVEWTVGGLRRAHTQVSHQSGIKTGLVLCPRSMSVVTNSTPGFIQFYDPQKDSVIQELNVTNLNYVSRPDDSPLVLTTVDQVTFSPNGDWLATVESRDDGKTAAELRMKLWQFSSAQQCYTVNTCVEPPHDLTVTSLAFQPLSPRNRGNKSSNQIPLLVSTSLDGHFKTWVLLEEEVGVASSWACRSTGYYHDLPCLGACFSEDGSLLAVNFRTCLTVWDPVSCELRKTLANPFQGGDYKHMVFGHKSSSQYLVASSVSHLQVWDLLSCSVIWCVKATVDLLVSDPLSQLTAAFVSSRDSPLIDLYLFDPSFPTPLAIHKSVCLGQPLGGLFVPPTSSGGQSTLYFMSNSQVLYALEEEGKEKAEEPHPSQMEMVSSSERAFRDIFGDLRQQNTVSTVTPGKLTKASKPSLSLINAPAHVLPPMPTLCLPFVTSLLPPLPGSKGQDDDDEPESMHEEQGHSSDSEGQQEVGVASNSTLKMDVDIDSECKDLEVRNYDWLVDHFRTLY